MRWLVIIVSLLLGGGLVSGATFAESRAFKQASDIFSDKIYSIAETNFAAFVAKFPNSELRSEAILYQGKARFFQKNYNGALELLQGERAQAGNLADQYDFWLAQGLFQSGKIETAAEKYGEMIKNFPASPLVLEACYNQAFSYSRLGNWARTAELLSHPEGEFQKAIRSNFSEPVAIQGLLLLAEAFYERKQFPDSEKVLKQLETLPLHADARWRQQYLRCRVLLANGRLEEALVASSNLVKTATDVPEPRVQAETMNVQAQILENLERYSEAIEIYATNLADALPQDLRRQALFKMIELTLAQDKTDEAIVRLEKFAAQHTNDTALDLVYLTLGELRLKQFFTFSTNNVVETNGVPPLLTRTNFFELALTNLSLVITNFPQSSLLGRAYLGRGWCRWVEQKLGEAQTDFSEAAQRLPVSEEQAVARFKLADTQFKMGDHTNAVVNYGLVIRDYEKLASITNSLFDQALYQIIRASIVTGDHSSAQDAMEKIMEWYPNSGFAERGVLLVGQQLNRKGSSTEARELFSSFAKKFPESPLLPEVELAVARTFVQEGKWEDALSVLNRWIEKYPGHTLLPQAEFSQALTTFQAGMETNAFNLFTNFIARNPSNSLAPVAENWLGDFYANRDELELAESHYQRVAQYNPPLELACQARMNAGRAAFERQGPGFKAARDYFASLINDTNTPSQFQAEAYFALGDVIYTQFIAEKVTNDFPEAISAFTQVIQNPSANGLVPLAWGKIGECCFQFWNVTKDASYLEHATNAFLNVLQSPQASVSARSQAEVGLGMVLESSGQSNEALDHYVKVLYVNSDEEFDSIFVKQAGLSAARICENGEQWEQAINIYQRLLNTLPSLKQALEKKIAIARTQLQSKVRP